MCTVVAHVLSVAERAIRRAEHHVVVAWGAQEAASSSRQQGYSVLSKAFQQAAGACLCPMATRYLAQPGACRPYSL